MIDDRRWINFFEADSKPHVVNNLFFTLGCTIFIIQNPDRALLGRTDYEGFDRNPMIAFTLLQATKMSITLIGRLLQNGSIRGYAGIVDNFSQTLEQFFSIVVEIAVDSINLLVLDHVKTAFRISN